MNVTAFPGRFSSVKNPISFEVESDPNWNNLTDYHIQAVVQFYDPYGSTSIFTLDTLKEYPNAKNAGKVVFNISDLLESLLDHDPPDQGNVFPDEIKEKMNRRYSVSIQEWINNAINDADHYTFKHVLLAGFPEQEGQAMEAWISSGKFLTRQPREKIVTKCQPEYLSFVVPDVSLTGIKINVEVTFEDGSTLDVSDGTTYAIDQFEVMQIKTGYEALGLGVGSPVQCWEVWITVSGGSDDGLVITERMKYCLDCTDCSVLDRYYVFENSLGGYDTLRTVGELKATIEVEGRMARKIPHPLAAAGTRTVIDYGTRHRHQFEQYVGYLEKEVAYWLQDLLTSDDFYRIGDWNPNTTGTGLFIPLVRSGNNTLIYKDNDFFPAKSFKYKEALIQRGI